MTDLKLGKAKPQRDSRNILANALFKAGRTPKAPSSFDVDVSLKRVIDNPVYRNSGERALGDCVVAARANMTRRFEALEQNTLIDITEAEVVAEYYREQGYPPNFWLWRLFWRTPPDNGLPMLDSLKSWRAEGWTASGQFYDIYAFAALNWFDYTEVMAGIYLLSGAYAGLNLPASARPQIGGCWVPDNSMLGWPGTWGRHCVYVKAYDKDTLTCVTWGSEQRMTWEFWHKYVDEAYLIVDNQDRFVKTSPIDVKSLEKILGEVTA